MSTPDPAGTPDDRDDELETLAPSQFGEPDDPDPVTEAPTTTD